jgi:DNA-binding CsgD family transcriptional regulator
MIADANDDQPGPMLPWSLMDDLTRLIPAEEVSICDLDLANREREQQQDVLEDDPRFVDQGEPCPGALDLFWRYYTTHWTGFLPSKAGQVRRWSDRYPGRMLLQNPLYQEFFRPMGRRYFLSVGLVAPAGHERNLMFWRHSGPDFSDRDKDLLGLLRPHVAEIYAGAVRRRRGVLTPREWEVLELAAQGHGNAEIAAILVTSVSTVRKHMENIFDRTGVRTRGAAVARMLPQQRSPFEGGRSRSLG